MHAGPPRILKVCLVTPYPPQEKGAAEYANMFVEALHGSSYQRQLYLHIISEITEQCPRSQKLLYSPEGSFILERVYLDRFPYNNLGFLRMFKAVLKVKPHVAHFYWPGDYGGVFGEPLLMLFALLRLVSVQVLVSVHGMPRWFPKFIESAALEKAGSRVVARAVRAYFFVFMLAFCHLVNRMLLGVVREESGIVKRFAECYKVMEDRIGEEPHGCLEMKARDVKAVRRIRRRLNIVGKKVVLCFGFVRPGKGLEYAIRALAGVIRRDRNVVLIIAGKAKTAEDKSYLIKLKKLAKELNVEGHVIFDNRFIPREEVIDYYSVADVFLLPYSEEPVGFSGPLLSAISLGVPVIASGGENDMPGLKALIKLVPPKDVEALEESINEMLFSVTLRDKIKAKLRSHATRYSWSKLAERLVDTYEGMLT